MSEREESYSTDVEEFSESGGTDPSDRSRISSISPYFYEPETNTEGSAKHYGVILWNNRKSWVKVLIILKNKRRHNEKAFMFLCLSCQDMKLDTMFYY